MAEASEKSVVQGLVDSRHRCTVCKKILREAVQLFCGCRVCKRCGDCNVSDGGVYCPKCKKSFTYFADKSIRKEIEDAYNASTSGRCVTEKPKHGSPKEKLLRKQPGLTHNGITSRKGQRIQQESTHGNGKGCVKVPKKIPIRQEQRSTYCGECYSQVFLKDLLEHRRICWKLHLYDGKSFRSYADDVQQVGVQICAPRLRTGQHRIVRSVGDGIMDGFSQFREMYCYIQDDIMKLRHDVQQMFKRPDAIEDPVYITMKWKVENVSNRIAERCALTSRSFQSSQSEYKLCLKLEFYGDTFLVRLVLLRGEHDESLQWPFRKTVILSVLSQHTMDAYELPPILPNVQRCRDSHGTVVSSLTSPLALRPFIIDNCLFIHCTVV